MIILMAKIISLLMEKADIWVLYDYTQGERFYRGKSLIADAAHESTPHHRARAGMYLEDALILLNPLGSLHRARTSKPHFRHLT